MPRRFLSSRFFICAALACAAHARVVAAGSATSEWVHPDAKGKLVYKTTPAGDRIMDFSGAGYHGGGVALPDVAVKKTVQPADHGDDTSAIQAAIDAVGALPLENGFRGAVLLAPGTFTTSKPIVIGRSGVVLRGSGSGPQGTTLKMVGGRHRAIVIGAAEGSRRARRTSDEDEEEPATNNSDAGKTVSTPTATTTLTDAYVPAGTNRITVADAKGFSVGDAIAIRRPPTSAWLHFMGMDTLKRDGRPQTWIGSNRFGVTERKIAAIQGNVLTLDLPLADSYDARYLNPPGVTVSSDKSAPAVTEVGVEHLHLQCPPLEIAYGNAPYSAIRVGGDDCWVKDVYCEETMNSTTLAGKRITMEQVVITHTFPNLGASKPTDFSIEGSQILIDRCRVTGDNEYFVWTGSLEPGPNVILNSTFNGHGSRIQPHMRWSTGMLVDNCKVPDGGIDFMNRGVAGSGHGWTMGWAVAWNCVAKTYVIQSPPGVFNWAIGCIGTREQTARLFDVGPILPEGTFDSAGQPVAPQSLYLAQLAERLGRDAVAAIGYSSDHDRSLTFEPIRRLPALSTDDDPELGPDLALHRPVNTSGVRGATREFGGEKAVDGNPKTYWATNDNPHHPALEIDLEGPVEINAAVLEEAAGLHHVQAYRIEGAVDSDWKLLAEGTTIGDRKVDHFPPVTAWKVRLTILDTDSYPAIRKFGLYRTAGAATPKAPAAH